MFIWANVEVNFGVISGQYFSVLNFTSYADRRVPQLARLCYDPYSRCTKWVHGMNLTTSHQLISGSLFADYVAVGNRTNCKIHYPASSYRQS